MEIQFQSASGRSIRRPNGHSRMRPVPLMSRINKLAIAEFMPFGIGILKSRNFARQLKFGVAIEDGFSFMQSEGLLLSNISARNELGLQLFGEGYIPSIKTFRVQAEGTRRLFDRVFGNERQSPLGTLVSFAAENAPLAFYALDAQVSEAIYRLPKDMRDIILLRFALGGRQEHSLSRAGVAIGVSAPEARDIEARAIAKLSKPCISPYFAELHNISANAFDYLNAAEPKA